MKIPSRQIAGVLNAGYFRFVAAHNILDTPHMKSGFFAGAAVAIASQDGDEAVIAALIAISVNALKS